MNKKLRPVLAGALAVAIAATMGITVWATGTDGTAAATPAVTSDPTTAVPDSDGGFGRHGDRAPLTDEQKAQMKADMDARMKAKLDELVAAGTITQEQADAAYAIVTATTGRIDFSALPAEVASALKASMGKNHDRILNDLTTDQQAAVKAVLDESLNSALASLVSAGTLTQEQADAISAEPHDRAAMESLTAEQRDAIRTAIDDARKAGLAALVTNGTLTQDQADRLGQGRHGGRGGMEGRGGCGDRAGRPNDNGNVAPTSDTTATETPAL